MRSGIDHLNRKDVEQGLFCACWPARRLRATVPFCALLPVARADGTLWRADLAAALVELGRAVQPCGLPTVVADIRKVADKINAGPAGWLSLLVDEILKFWENRKTVGHDVHEAIKNWEKKEFFGAGFYTGQLLGKLLQFSGK